MTSGDRPAETVDFSISGCDGKPLFAVIYDAAAKPRHWWQFWRKPPLFHVIDLRDLP